MSVLCSQILGISLAVTTALGCIAYERLVKSCGYGLVGMLVSLSYLPFWATFVVIDGYDSLNLRNLKGQWMWCFLFLFSGITGPLWYQITRHQSVMTGAIYEVKYIVVMIVIYAALGTQKVTVNTVIGFCLALGSVYFVSKG